MIYVAFFTATSTWGTCVPGNRDPMLRHSWDKYVFVVTHKYMYVHIFTHHQLHWPIHTYFATRYAFVFSAPSGFLRPQSKGLLSSSRNQSAFFPAHTWHTVVWTSLNGLCVRTHSFFEVSKRFAEVSKNSVPCTCTVEPCVHSLRQLKRESLHSLRQNEAQVWQKKERSEKWNEEVYIFS